VQGLQLWRPLTAASFMGNIGPQLLQKCYYLIQFGRGLEATLGVGEYARVLASSTAMLCLISSALGFQFVGDGLIEAITVLACQQSPDQVMNLYGLNLPCAYFPFAQVCMSYLFTQQIPWNDILGALVGYAHYYFNDNTKPDKALADRMPPAPAAKPGGRKVGGGGGGGGSKTASARKAARRSRVNSLANSAACGPGG